MADSSYPLVIFLFSGKRKSGKDHTVNKLMTDERTKYISTVIRLSEPLKREYARDHNLDLIELLSDTPYKETYRKDMIEWGESKRDTDYGFFCKAACDSAPTTPVWIVSDVRRKTDLKWFEENYANRFKTVRIVCSEDCRKSRGWEFTVNVDDRPSECDLDDVNDWDFVIDNDNQTTYDLDMKVLTDFIEKLKLQYKL